jgi:hypothetical protein
MLVRAKSVIMSVKPGRGGREGRENLFPLKFPAVEDKCYISEKI